MGGESIFQCSVLTKLPIIMAAGAQEDALHDDQKGNYEIFGISFVKKI